MPMFEAAVKGYPKAARDFITPLDISRLSFSDLLVTLGTGSRSLTDLPVEGDVYFKTEKEDYSQLRTHTRLRLVESMEEQMPEKEE